MAVDLEKAKRFVEVTRVSERWDVNPEYVCEQLEGLVAEVERLRAQVTNHEWVIKDMGRELRRLEGGGVEEGIRELFHDILKAYDEANEQPRDELKWGRFVNSPAFGRLGPVMR